jgi:O-antigen/teichoic acid export membrane protein
MALAAYTMKFLGPPKLGFGFRKLLGFSAPLFAGEIASYASGWFDRALLVPLVPLAQLGSYQVAITAFGILNSMSAAISGTLFPFYSHFYAGGGEVSRTVDLENAVKSASRYVSFFTIPLSVGLAVTALPAATLLAGNIYADAAVPVAILSISLALACQARALGSIFIVLGKTVTSAILTIASLSIPILMGFAIIPYLGIAGAAIVRGSSLIISLAISVSILRMILRLRFDTAAYRSTWLASLAMAGAVLVVEALNYSKYLLPVYVAVGAAVFILALRSLRAVNREDLDLMSDFLEPRLGFVVNWLEKLLGVEGSSLSASAAK